MATKQAALPAAASSRRDDGRRTSSRLTAFVKALRTRKLKAVRPPRPAASMTPSSRDLSSAWKQEASRASKLEKAREVRRSCWRGWEGWWSVCKVEKSHR